MIKITFYITIKYISQRFLEKIRKKRDLEGTRTPNPLIRSQKLYPLSHETTYYFNEKKDLLINLVLI